MKLLQTKNSYVFVFLIVLIFFVLVLFSSNKTEAYSYSTQGNLDAEENAPYTYEYMVRSLVKNVGGQLYGYNSSGRFRLWDPGVFGDAWVRYGICFSNQADVMGQGPCHISPQYTKTSGPDDTNWSSINSGNEDFGPGYMTSDWSYVVGRADVNDGEVEVSFSTLERVASIDAFNPAGGATLTAGDSIDITWATSDTTSVDFSFAGPVTCDQNGAVPANYGSTCTSTGPGGIQVSLEVSGYGGGGPITFKQDINVTVNPAPPGYIPVDVPPYSSPSGGGGGGGGSGACAVPMTTDSAVRGGCNSVSVQGYPSTAAGCAAICAAQSANGCEWEVSTNACYVEFGSGCYIQGGFPGWYASAPAATACPVDGGWSAWSPASCPTACGQPASTLTRTCTNPSPANGGAACSGSSTTNCSATAACAGPPVDGGWSAWSPASCPTSCGQPASTLTRSCTNPAPANGGAQCSGASTQNCSATAACAAPGFSLAVTKTAGGSVQSTDNFINCGSTCNANYVAPTNVTLQAYPASSYWKFSGWSGDCTGAGLCTLTVSAAKAVQATFSLRAFNYFEF